MLFNAKLAMFLTISRQEQDIFEEMIIGIRLVLGQQAYLYLYSVSSLKQQSERSYVARLGHIILIPSQPASLMLLFSSEIANTNFIVFGSIQIEFEPTNYYTCAKHAYHYSTDAVSPKMYFN